MTLPKKIIPMHKISALYSSLVSGVMMVGAAALTGPMSAFAASPTTGYCADVPTSVTTLGEFIKVVVCFLQQSIVPFLFALAVAVFIWGMVKFIGTQESAEREEGRQFMMWGIIALTVMFCVWGLVNLLGQTFSVKSAIPQLPVN